MELGIGWLGVGVGLAGWLALGFMARGDGGGSEAERSRGRLVFWVTALTGIVFWAVGMQRQSPFSTGQTLAFGFLIGAVVGAVAGMVCFKPVIADVPTDRRSRLGLQSAMFFSLFSVSLTYLIFHGNPMWALIGYSIGTVMAAILSHYTGDTDASPAIHIESWAVFGVGLSMGVLLAMAHFNQAHLRSWWPIPILIAVTVLVSSYIGTELSLVGRDSGRPRNSVAVLVTVLLTGGLSAVYSWGY